MGKLLINLENVHIDEITELRENLENDCWQNDTLSKNEVNQLIWLINNATENRMNLDLSYLELINLKNEPIKRNVKFAYAKNGKKIRYAC